MQLPQAYIKVKEIDTRLGKVILYTNPARTLLYAEASGYISLGILKQDLAFVSDFDQSQTQPLDVFGKYSSGSICTSVESILFESTEKQQPFEAVYRIYSFASSSFH